MRGNDCIEGLLKQAQEIIERGGDASDLLAHLDRAIELEEALQRERELKAQSAERELAELRFIVDAVTREEAGQKKNSQRQARLEALARFFEQWGGRWISGCGAGRINDGYFFGPACRRDVLALQGHASGFRARTP